MIHAERFLRTRHTEKGFSLVETVAAMGILALAAVPLVQLTSEAIRNTAYLESRLMARTVAENVMARLFANPAPVEAGIQLGQETQMSRTYAWTQLVGPPDATGLQLIDISVARAGDSQVLARLVSVKSVPRKLPGQVASPQKTIPGGAQ